MCPAGSDDELPDVFGMILVSFFWWWWCMGICDRPDQPGLVLQGGKGNKRGRRDVNCMVFVNTKQLPCVQSHLTAVGWRRAEKKKKRSDGNPPNPTKRKKVKPGQTDVEVARPPKRRWSSQNRCRHPRRRLKPTQHETGTASDRTHPKQSPQKTACDTN